MITEDYVSFETAKLLKEKGFNSISFHCYEEKETNDILFVILSAPLSNSDLDNTIEPHKCYSAPTLQMAMKWFRKIHNIHIEVNLGFSEDPIKYPPFYYVYILDSKSGNSVIDPAARIDGLNPLVDVDNTPKNFNTYEEACEAAIKYCLENLV